MRVCVLAAMCAASVAFGQISSEFTYQGSLADSGNAADGLYDMEFALFDALVGGVQVGSTYVLEDVNVDDGLFTAILDFGINPFNEDRWLEITVEGQTLTPRQQVTAAPAAVQLRGVTVGPQGYFGIGTTSPGAKLEVRVDETEAILGVSLFQNGVFGASAAAARGGVGGSTSSPDGYGVVGSSNVLNGSARGVYGRSFGETGAGVYGLAQNTNGANFGVYGETVSSATFASGVHGYASSPTGTTRGGYFASESSTNGASGVIAQGLATSGTTFGVQASVASPNGRAVSGFVGAASGGTAVIGSNNNDDGWAGRFLGRVFMRDHTAVGKEGVRITSAESFGVHTTAENTQFGGMYVSGQNAGARPFYGYSSSGVTNDIGAYHYFDGNTDQWRLWCGADRITVNKGNGRVGIGTGSPGFLLEVAGTAGKPGGGSWSVASDARLKKDVDTLDNALESMLALRGVTFEYIDPDAISELSGERMGLVAQDVENVFPDWIEEGDDGFKRMTVRGFEAVVVEAMRELRAEKDTQIQTLQAENDDLRDRLAALEDMVALMLEENK